MLPLREQNEELAAANASLKAQVEQYGSKFEDFQSTLTKSNQVGPGLGGVQSGCTAGWRSLLCGVMPCALWAAAWGGVLEQQLSGPVLCAAGAQSLRSAC